jgi:demethylmenaquinone methyltransferase/2-methoxy-6-polyprenyl-1,4-benzoquinol methylase
MRETITPYNDNSSTKKEQVADMFNNIAPRYDFLNHFLSFGIDILWRKKAIRLLKNCQPKFILDIATGTGDLAITALTLNPEKVIGVDVSEGMLSVGKAKIKAQGQEHKIELQYGDAENLPFPDNTFDAIIVAFGVRNFEHLEKGLGEMLRVLKPGGTTVILEFSNPVNFPVKQLYTFYSKKILPVFGKLISKNKRAYTYLPESVKAFPFGADFLSILNNVGFKETKCISLTLGIASIYVGKK